MHMNLDPVLVDKIVNEVKSQGVFDQFRKDSMADVDTKPAYQNLRQRVETTVTKFLSDQIWTTELNKNQLREKLRKHITEAGFLDTGVERIVDQVVNPKISTVFQPKIEDIAYAFLGIEKPQIKIEEKPVSFTNGDMSIKTDFLPTDLEAVSPDSDKTTTDEKFECKEELLNDSDDKNEEFESPPFEPLEGLGCPPSPVKKEESNHSQISGISGLTSQDSIGDAKEDVNVIRQADVTQESELSEVSSNSRLSIVTNGEDSKPEIKLETDVGISEEAQMPKFSDSASSNLESGEHLHFDIKKEEIKFEGTDWKGEKRDYFSCISENLPKENVEIKTEFEAIIPEKEQSAKTEDVSASSNLTYSTDTQISAASKFNDFEKFEKEIKSSSENYYEENNLLNPRVPDKTEENEHEKYYTTPTPSTPKERTRSHKKSHKRTSEIEKYNSSESSRHDSRSPRTSSSTKKHKSISEHSKHKSRSHKSKHSREKHHKSSRDKTKDRKHMVDKDNKGKTGDYCSDRKKKYRRKSTDSNDEADASKDTSKNTSTSSLDRIAGVKESNTSNSSNYSSANTNGSVEDGSNAAANDGVLRVCEQANRNSELIGNYSKPIILDNLLGSEAKSNIELIIGAKISIDTKQIEEEKQLGEKKEQHKYLEEISSDLEYFEEDPVENENCRKLLEKLSKAIYNRDTTSDIYINNCDEDFRHVFEKLGLNVVGVEAENVSGTSVYKETQVKNINDRKVIGKVNGSVTENMKKGSKTINSLPGIIAPNGKRKRNIDNYYQPATYCVFADDKIRNNTHSLIIDCFEYSGTESSNKKIKTSNFTIEPFVAKISPTPSELSVGSKENEFADKKVSEKCTERLENIVPRKRSISLRASQRYSSEDLYKPRPVLGQRSKRRAIETEVM